MRKNSRNCAKIYATVLAVTVVVYNCSFVVYLVFCRCSQEFHSLQNPHILRKNRNCGIIGANLDFEEKRA